MLQLLNKLSFLEDITKETGPPEALSLFKDAYKEYRVVDCPKVTFKISSDWYGNWLAGSWYYNDIKITNPDELLVHLSRSDVVKLAHHLDILEQISSWDKDKFIKSGV